MSKKHYNKITGATTTKSTSKSNLRRAEKAYYKYYVCISTQWQTLGESERYLLKKYGRNARTWNIINLMNQKVAIND